MEFLRDVPGHCHSSQTLPARTRVSGHLCIRAEKASRGSREAEKKGDRARKGRKRKRTRGGPASVEVLSSSTWGTKKLSYNCCTPRAAPLQSLRLIVISFRVHASTTRIVLHPAPCALCPRPTSLSTDLLRVLAFPLWPTAREITVITRIYEGLRGNNLRTDYRCRGAAPLPHERFATDSLDISRIYNGSLRFLLLSTDDREPARHRSSTETCPLISLLDGTLVSNHLTRYSCRRSFDPLS